MPAATLLGEPDAGNPHVRFDEGRVRRAIAASLTLLLYCSISPLSGTSTPVKFTGEPVVAALASKISDL